MLGPLPREVFNESGRSGAAASKGRLTPDVAATLPAVFEWCDNAHNRNNSSNRAGVDLVQLTLTHRTAKKIAVRRDLHNWVFLYFRARRVSWEFMVHEERANYSQIDLFSEGVLDRWTVKLRFRMKREAPMKFPLMAFLSRMGLDADADLVFTTDGFFGDMLVGSVRKRNVVPHKVVSYNTTADALGMQNGDSVFVVRASPNLRANVESQLGAARRRSGRLIGLADPESLESDDAGSEDSNEDESNDFDISEDSEIFVSSDDIPGPQGLPLDSAPNA
ncbi:hypothetical protein BOX15_Mlig006860g1 [Macrostomum lignano]|uniref:Uncharacterized protein n=1 Tax=Macrostomum lignano TaxID=282301 RepID=A0A267EIC2_9PLAT|nr:hypothetical protein BOX15_Mlig006860g1 [Macrostomum lignano]